MVSNGFRRRWVILLAGGLLCCAAGLLTRAAWKHRRSRPAPADIVSPNPRHSRVDVDVVRGLTVSEPGAGWSLHVGSVEIRRKSLGFIRLGAFNEALISDLCFTMAPRHDPSNFVSLLRQLGSFPDPREALARRGGRTRARLAHFLESCGVRSPYQNIRVSSVRIHSLSLRVSSDDPPPDVVLLSAGSAAFHGGNCRLGGAVSFGRPDGQRVICREAELSLAAEPMISARSAMLSAAGATQEIEFLSFPLAVLLAGEDLRPYADQSRNRTR